MPPMINMTITVPEGTSNHGDPDILCVPAKWTDILAFYAVNYLAHAVTVKALPGEKIEETAYFVAMALIYPYSGLMRGIEAITRRAAWCRGNELQRAARAGALCVVVRDKNWRPLDGQVVDNVEVWELPKAWREAVGDDCRDGVVGQDLDEIEVNTRPTATWFSVMPHNFYEGFGSSPVISNDRTVHGSRYLPPGYTLAYLPSNTKIDMNFRGDIAEVSISSSYSLVKAVVSIVQVCFASTTIYKTRGDQLNRYGYAAFGLTVLPYVIMSIVNLFGNLLTPDFPTMYLVRSPEMAEAEDSRRGGWFDGVVGVVKSEPKEGGISVRFEEVENGFLIHPITPPLAAVEYGGEANEQGDEAPSTPQPVIPIDADSELEIENMGQGIRISHETEAKDEAPPIMPPLPRRYLTSIAQRPQQLTPEEQLRVLSTIHQIATVQTEKPTTPAMYSILVKGRGFPSKFAINNMLSKPKHHLKIPAASNFHYIGNQAWSAYRVAGWTGVAIYMSAIPLGVIGGLTHFHKGDSTRAQRVWIMGWLVVGTVLGATLPFYIESFTEDFSGREGNRMPPPGSGKWRTLGRWALKIELLLIYAAFAVGGFVVVGQQLKSYGSCSKLS